MEDLIKALQILVKYENKKWPTHCEQDVLNVDIDADKVSEEDKKILDELGFHVDEEDNTFSSFRFGSC